jgi:hypothetical protein
MLMNLDGLSWNEEIAGIMGVPTSMLPEIKASIEVYGDVSYGGALNGVPIAGILGDQQAATFGQTCFAPGEAKNTYGTGNFLLLNTGTEAVQSKNGMLTTVGYKIGDEAPAYCLEGAIAITGGARAVAARQPEDDQGGAGGRGAGADGGGQRRLLHRAGVLRAVRPLLEVQCAWGGCGSDALRERGAHRPRDPGSHRLPVA